MPLALTIVHGKESQSKALFGKRAAKPECVRKEETDMRTRNVVVVDYDPQWEKNFQVIRGELQAALGEIAIAVEHVGSTAVPGLAAKPILDIDVVIDQASDLPEAVERLRRVGYIHEGNLGIPGRDAFGYVGKEHLQAHHLYVCPKDSREFYRHIQFREYLRAHPEAREAYGQIKKEAARRFPKDIDRYMEYKSACILEIYQKCGLEPSLGNA